MQWLVSTLLSCDRACDRAWGRARGALLTLVLGLACLSPLLFWGCGSGSPQYISFPDAGISVGPANELPCDIAAAFAVCTGCHGNPPTNNAPIPLVTYDDLTAPSGVDPTKRVVDRAVLRMQAGTMPPGGGVPPAAIGMVQSWITAGAPKGSCDQTPDGGPAGVCTSGQYYSGRKGSELMHPGRTCLACHAQLHGPMLAVAGTVFPTFHEPDDCLSTSVTGTQVEITDANHVVQTVPVNANGNFLIPGANAVTMPYTARVLYQGRVRVMIPPQTSGDCNSCHTETGLGGTPGRIRLP